MSFDETKVRRDGDGQFAPKQGAESDVVLSDDSGAEPAETLQTSAPLERAICSNTSVPVTQLVRQIEDGDLDLDPPCQRGDVWGTRRRRMLVRSLLQGLPVPPVMLNDRLTGRFSEPGMSQKQHWAKACIDGRQRLTTISMFTRDELDVPASWFADEQLDAPPHETDDGPYVSYSQLTLPTRRRFENAPVGVVEFYLPSLDEEQQVFDRFNYGGVAQGDADDD